MQRATLALVLLLVTPSVQQAYNVVFNNNNNVGQGGAACASTQAPSALTGVAKIIARGKLICGTGGDNAPFFSYLSGSTRVGFDVAQCQAVAAAIFTDYATNPARLQLAVVDTTTRWQMIQDGSVDMVASTTTHTQDRSATYGVHFGPTTYFDGTGVAGRASDTGVTALSQVTSGTVCAAAGSTTVAAATTYFAGRTGVTVVGTRARADILADFQSPTGTCNYLADDLSSLSSFVQPAFGKVLSGGTFSRQPLAPFVSRQVNPGLGALLDAVINALILAELNGVTRANVANELYPASVAAGLGVAAGFSVRAIQAVGNYGEIYAAYAQPKIPRTGTQNQLFTNGGLIYPTD